MNHFSGEVFREENGQRIPGQRLWAYIHNGPSYYLTELRVFRDGMVSCPDLVTFKRFRQKVEEGWVVTALPENAQVSVSLLGRFVATSVRNGVSEAELVKEVADLIEELNDRPSASARCRAALKTYQETPTEEAKAVLREAYEAIPAHHRIFVLGDQDVKDLPIRMILYGEQELESWSHRQAGKKLGMASPPEIDVSEALESVLPSPKRKLERGLGMALMLLYQHSGVGQPLFPRGALEEVEELFRSGQAEEGVRRIWSDVRSLRQRYSRRPSILTRLAGSLDALGDYLEAKGRFDEAAEAHLEALELNPDGLASFGVARLATARGDAALARRLVAKMAELELPPLSEDSLARALGIDLPRFLALASH